MNKKVVVDWIRNNISPILLSLYLYLIWISYLYLNSYCDKGFWIISLLVLTASALISFTAIKVIKKFSLELKEDKPNSRKAIVFICATLVSLGLLLLRYFTYYPGAFSGDSNLQYLQAINESVYNDWHPVWHTLVIFKLPLLITGTISSIVLFQIIYFSLTIGYMGMVIYKHTSIKVTLLSLAFVLLNQYTGSIVIYPWKDVAFAIACGLAFSMAFEVYASKKWANSWRMVLLGIALANATLFRHNGILFTAVLIIALYFFLNRKNAIVMTVAFIAFLILVKGPVYSLVNAEKAERRTIETMGLSLNIIANVAKEAPDKMSDETAEFIYSLAPSDVWQYNYQVGDFNTVKFLYIDVMPVEQVGKKAILKMALDCFINAPRESLRGAIATTRLVYCLDYVGNDANPYYSVIPFEREVNTNLESFINSLNSFASFNVLRYAGSLGMMTLCMLAVILAKNSLVKFSNWKKIFLGLPIFIHNFGTMLLLTGQDVRFFYLTFLICPLVIVLMLFSKKDSEEVV